MTNTDSKKRRKRITAAVSMVLILALLGGTFAWNNYRQHKTNDASTKEMLYKATLVEEYDRTRAQNWDPENPELTKKISVFNPGNTETQGDDKTYGDIFARIQLKEFMEFYPVVQDYTQDRYMIGTDGQFIKFFPGTNYDITADAETGWPVVLETDAPAGGTIFEGGEDAAAEYARILSLKADNGLHQVRRQRIYFTPLRTTSVAANYDSIDSWLRHYNAVNNTNLLLPDITIDGAGETLNVNSQYLPAGLVNPETGLDDNELPWLIQTKENDPNGVYGNFVLLDAQADNANPRNMLIDEDENGIADFLQTPIPERANEDQKKDPDGKHDELIDSAVDVGYTMEQVNGECEYTPHRWTGGMNKWDVNGPNNPSFFDYIEWTYGENVILLSDWDGKPVKKWIIDDRAEGNSDGVADFLQTPIPERADEDQKKSPDGLHDELIDSAVDVGYTIPQVNGECEYTVHQWVDGMNQWDVNGQNMPSYFDYIEWVFGENVILLSNWDGNPVKKWIIDDRDAGNNDGWVWWGHYLAPGEQTSNLLESLMLVAPSDEKTYYALHADMQAVSYEELTRWEEDNDTSGNDQIVDALRRSILKISSVTIKEEPAEIMRGTTFEFSAAVRGSVGVNKAVTWSLLGYNGTLSSIDQNGLLTIGAAETATQLTVRATSVYDNTKYATWTFNVRPDNSVDGASHIIPGSKLNDDSDWMAIAEEGGYYLIVRLNSLPVGQIIYMPSGNYNYSTSNVKQAIELWYDNINTGTNAGPSTGTLEGLKSFAVRSDADTVTGSYANITAAISKPNAATGYAYPFALSFQEAALFMGTGWNSSGSTVTPSNTQYAASNWQTLSNSGDGTGCWLRSTGSYNTAAALQTALGQIGNGDVDQNGGTIRPAMWVRAEIFN